MRSREHKKKLEMFLFAYSVRKSSSLGKLLLIIGTHPDICALFSFVFIKVLLGISLFMLGII